MYQITKFYDRYLGLYDKTSFQSVYMNPRFARGRRAFVNMILEDRLKGRDRHSDYWKFDAHACKVDFTYTGRGTT